MKADMSTHTQDQFLSSHMKELLAQGSWYYGANNTLIGLLNVIMAMEYTSPVKRIEVFTYDSDDLWFVPLVLSIEELSFCLWYLQPLPQRADGLTQTNGHPLQLGCFLLGLSKIRERSV